MLSWFEKQQILWSLPPEERIKAIFYKAQIREQQREETRRRRVGAKRARRMTPKEKKMFFWVMVYLAFMGAVGAFH